VLPSRPSSRPPTHTARNANWQLELSLQLSRPQFSTRTHHFLSNASTFHFAHFRLLPKGKVGSHFFLALPLLLLDSGWALHPRPIRPAFEA